MQIESAVKIVKEFVKQKRSLTDGFYDDEILTAISVLLQHSEATRDIAKQFFEASQIVSRN